MGIGYEREVNIPDYWIGFCEENAQKSKTKVDKIGTVYCRLCQEE